MRRRILHLPLPGVTALALTGAAGAQAVSEPFDYPDGPLAGRDGGTGWANAWGGNGGNRSVTVSSGQAQIAKSDSTAAITATAFRTYDTALLTSPYSINFQIRPVTVAGFEANDSEGATPGPQAVNGGFTTSYVDYLQAFSRSAGTVSQGDFANDGTWLIRSRPTAGTDTDDTADDVQAWHLFNYRAGVQNGFGDADLINTGLTITAGTTYTFQVDILGGGKWNATVSDGTTTFNSTTAVPDGLGFRSNAALPSGNVYFGIRDVGANGDGEVTMAFDNISVSNVPEPASAGVLGLAVAGLLAGRRRRGGAAV